MTDIQIQHDRLLTKLREAVGAVVDIDGGGEQAIEVASTALVDMTAIVLARLPVAAVAEGASTIGVAMTSRLVRRMAVEAMLRGQMMGLPSAASLAPDQPAPAEKITKTPISRKRGKRLN
jgi:hypothetical protein